MHQTFLCAHLKCVRTLCCRFSLKQYGWMEHASDNIDVTLICPGPVFTDIRQQLFTAKKVEVTVTSIPYFPEMLSFNIRKTRDVLVKKMCSFLFIDGHNMKIYFTVESCFHLIIILNSSSHWYMSIKKLKHTSTALANGNSISWADVEAII